jgi:non-specific serine/threonine protein kinase
LQPFWEAHGHFDEGRTWLEEALKKGEHTPGALRAKTLHAVCRMSLAQNDTHRTEIAAREGIGLSAELKITSWVAASFRRMWAYAVRVRGEYEQAKRLAEESLALSKEANDKPRMADALLELGVDSYSLGDIERGKHHLEEGIAVCREIGYFWRLADILNTLGYLLLLEAEYERAVVFIEESVDLYRERGIKGNLEYALDSLGWAALLSGQPERARTSYRECLTLCKELGNSLVASSSLEGLACNFAKEEAEQVAKLFGAAQALREGGEYHNTAEEAALREPYLAAARAGLDEAVWQEAYAAGKRMVLEEAVEYALCISESIPSTDAMLVQPPAGTRAVFLTRREEEITALVARGMTNRQIASEFTISEHTVATHVRRILKKLGLQSRAQLGSWLAERQAAADPN